MNSAPPLDDSIDFAAILARLRRGLWTTIAIALLGLAVGIVIALVTATKQPVVSSLRVTFGFAGFERGIYPDGAKFQPDDLRAPDVINEVLRRQGITGDTAELASTIRGAMTITGFVSPAITKERDRLRAAGQNPPPYVPDEYEISLSLPRSAALNIKQRELFLSELINVYLEKFRRTYVNLPTEFSDPFASLKNADFFEYELVLTRELQALRAYLEQRLDVDQNQASRYSDHASQLQTATSKQFRSPTNGLSFRDLLNETELFSQIRLNNVLSLIYAYSLSNDRGYAISKMDYSLRTLDDQELRLKEEEGVVTALLARTESRTQNYVLAAKAQPSSGAQPLLDQGFIDALLANDAYNFLVRQALDAGLAVKRVEAEKARILERRQRLESAGKEGTPDLVAVLENTRKALADLEISYQRLLGQVRVVLEDYARQEYADAIRISKQATTESFFVILALGGAVGTIAGLAFGLGLSLLRSNDLPLR